METTEKSVEVNVPLRMAYNQWTQFESFPHFMDGVEEVKQLDDKRLHWKAKLYGKEAEWDAVIAEQVPDERIAWHSTSGAQNAGTVLFHRLTDKQTKVTLRLGYDPEGILENLGDKLGLVSRQVEGDLERFKKFVEDRQGETGAWRGEVHRGEVGRSPTS
ncbi:MAG: SRPBCC family protein [Dehalococcoidia bacterium]